MHLPVLVRGGGLTCPSFRGGNAGEDEIYGDQDDDLVFGGRDGYQVDGNMGSTPVST
jgi:hypothetical protein